MVYNVYMPLAVVLFFVMFFGAPQAEAAQIQPILTWRAENYYPKTFAGRSFPGPRAPVFVALQVAKDGVFVSLNDVYITWFLDGEVYDKGRGKSEVKFYAKKTAGGSYNVKAQAKIGSDDIQKSVEVPVVKPEVVIVRPFAGNLAFSGEVLNFRAIPYFFTAPQNVLYFYWKLVGYGELTGRGEIFKFDSGAFGGGGNVTLSVSAQNPSNMLEFGKESLNFNIF